MFLSILCSLFFVSPILAQQDSTYTPPPPAMPGPIFWVCWLAFIILMVVSMWKVFTKAGEPGWAAIIPIVNFYFLCKIGGRPGWWLILMLIPLVNLIVGIIVCIDIAKNFGKGAASE